MLLKLKVIFWTFTLLYAFVKHKRVSNVNMSFPKSKFEWNLTTYMFVGCMFFASSQAERYLLYIKSFIMKKILNYFGFQQVRILLEKWNIYEAHIFPRSLAQTLWLETKSLWLNTQLRLNKTILLFHNFYWNLSNTLTFMYSTHNIKYNISHSRTQLSR